MSDTEFDLVVYGATSFAGQIVLRYLVSTYGVDGEVRWAVVARAAWRTARLAGFRRPPRPVTVEIERWADESGREDLRALRALWSGRRELHRVAAGLSRSSFRRLLRATLEAGVPVHELVSPGRAASVLAARWPVDEAAPGPEPLISLAARAVACGDVIPLERLADPVRRWPRGARRRLQRLLRGYAVACPTLSAALAEAERDDRSTLERGRWKTFPRIWRRR